MITNEGKLHVKRYLAGYVPAIAKSIAFGIGSRTEEATDIALQMETTQAPINLISYDFETDKIIYKATVPEEFSGKIYEFGIYSMSSNPISIDFASRNLSTFDSATESWMTSGQTPAPFGTTATRVGEDSLLISPAASGSLTYNLRNIFIDLDGYSNSDTFNFAFNCANAFTSSARVRFLTNSTNYYDFNLSSPVSGYQLVEIPKADAVATGTPDWSNINEIQVTVNSTAGGAALVEFDAIRVEDKDSSNLDYILVARKVLDVPVEKIAGQSQDIEFSLDVSIT